jgi:hypothetical protein
MAFKTVLRAGCLAITLVLAAGAARADDASDLAKARAAYEARNYEEADRRIKSMLDPDTGTLKDPSLRSRARVVWGAALLGLHRPAEASAVFESLLLDDPAFEPDPLSFPSDVVEAIIDTRKRIIDKINLAKADQVRLVAERKAREEEEKRRAAEHLRLVEKLASEETVIERHSRWRALVPFGVGQFQNGQDALGWTLLVSESVMLAGAIVAFPFWYYNRGRVNDLAGADATKDPLRSYVSRANAAEAANWIFNGAFGALWAIGVLHAEATFVPDAKETRKRQIGRVVPLIEPQRGGGVLGIRGSF